MVAVSAALALALIFFPAAVVGVPSGEIEEQGELALRPHPPIEVRADVEWMLPDSLAGNGVVGGLGTREDPFVISGWEIQFDVNAPAISISDTRAHVLLRDLLLRPAREPEPRMIDIRQAMVFLRTENVTVDRVRVEGDWDGSVFTDAEIEIRSATLANSSIQAVGGSLRVARLDVHGTARGPPLQCEACILDASDVSVTGYGPALRFARASPTAPMGISLLRANATLQRISGYHFGESPFIGIGESTVDWAGGHFENVTTVISAESSSMRISDLHHEAGERASATVHARDCDITLSHSTIRGLGSIQVAGCGLLVEHVEFLGVGLGIVAFPWDDDSRARLIVRNSSFVDVDQIGIWNQDPDVQIDARWNWWGGAGGPVWGDARQGRAGVRGAVLVEPWLDTGEVSRPSQWHAIPMVSPSIWLGASFFIGFVMSLRPRNPRGSAFFSR